jgi:WS/DGAT/MGAT family acyltransferase
MSKSLSFLDKSFWLTESEANPKHVASLQFLSVPKKVVAQGYVKSLVAEMRGFAKACPPFNCRVRTYWIYPLGLQPVKTMNMDYHVQLHRVEDVTDRKSIDDFVARIHETRLDPDKPLWQYHFLYDEHSFQYAIYARVHHMYGDGATLVRWFQAGYLNKPTEDTFVPVWAMKRVRHKAKRYRRVKQIWLNMANRLRTTRDFSVIVVRLLLKLLAINRHYMPLPFNGTKTVLTGQVKAGRAVATMDLDFTRIKAMAKRTRASSNEIILCAVDIGVHRLLQDYGHVFKKALYTNMPINLRKPGEKTTGNKIAIVPVELAYGERDPYLRLRQIIYNHRIVKEAAQGSSPGAFSGYTIVIQALALVFEWMKISDWLPPIGNILVSNIPGPKDRRYLKDSELLACYPISTMTPGGGVNVTLMTYAGTANIGLVCCNKHIRSLEPLAEYIKEAFTMLEASVDDPRLNIDDIGEHEDTVPVSIVSET